MEKGYEVSVERPSDYLHVRAEGIRTRLSVAALTGEVFKAATRDNRSRVLVDVRWLKGRLSVFDSLFIVREEFPKIRWQGIQRAAIVDLDIQGMRRWFFETAAQNRGFNLRVFAQEHKAREWLLQG
jgi:hypothetical protein